MTSPKRALIIGAGGIGKRHIRGFLKTDRVRLVICEPDRAKLGGVLRDYPVEKGYESLDDVPLETVDLAVIAAPAHLHVPMGMRLAEAGIPFLTEKPLSVTMDGVDRLVETVRDRKTVARVGYVRRSTPWVMRLRDDIRRGRIGAVRMAYVNVSQDYRKYRPDYARIYYARKETGGGVILDVATHMIDLLLWMMGPVAEVSAMYDRLVFDDTEVEDSALISLRFASGAMAQIVMNQFQKPNECSVEMIGTKGNLRLLDTVAQLQFADDDSGRWETERFARAEQELAELIETRFRLQADAFLDAVEGRPDHLTTIGEARDNLAVCLAAKESYQSKRIVPLSRP